MHSPAPALPPSPSESRTASLALLIGTIFWGSSFTWAKLGGETINDLLHPGTKTGAAGPLLLLGVRFVFAGVMWMLAFPRARRGWSWRSIGRTIAIGVPLGLGLIFQHLGLDQTSQAIAAFLTSLTIIFVPVISTIALRKSPRANVWLAVIVATIGVWLMTSRGGSLSSIHFGAGELMGLACAFVFSFYVLIVNALVPKDDPYRMTGSQFIFAGMMTLAALPFVHHGRDALAPHTMGHAFALRDVWLNGALLVMFPTLISYGLLTVYQPKLDATRATLIYLMEPIFASIFAYVVVQAAMTRIEIVGAAMILVANGIVEAWDAMKRVRTERAARGPA